MDTRTIVLEVAGPQWASSKALIESTLSRHPGIVAVDADPVARSATVTYDIELTSQAHLREWMRDCDAHCAGQPVPAHVCDPAIDATRVPTPATGGES
ncbi:heavy-metal-associated domain-containing protein [Microbacterium sp. NPDC078814]|uniref:heavy-metal-associated domain-containing protein n=1 Tax=Microbacterium sp. NPDC078814 TaxID=3154767 RepID=UPI00344CC35F